MKFSKTLDLDDYLVNRLPILKILSEQTQKIIRLKVISISNGIVLFANKSDTDDIFVQINSIQSKLNQEIGIIQNFEEFQKSLKDCSIEQDLSNYQSTTTLKYL